MKTCRVFKIPVKFFGNLKNKESNIGFLKNKPVECEIIKMK